MISKHRGDQNMDLYAQFAEIRIIATFLDSDSNTAKVLDTQDVTDTGGLVVEKSVRPDKIDGLVFLHWVVQGDATAFDFSQPIPQSVVQGAQYNNAFYVYFTSDGTPVEPQLVKSGELATQPTSPPTRAGYTFKHWTTTQQQAGQPLPAAYNFTTPVASTLQLYAMHHP